MPVGECLLLFGFFVTPWTATHQASLSFNISGSLLKLMSTESVMLSNHLIFSALFSFSFQSFPVSGSFPLSQLFTSDGQSIGASTSALVFPMNIQGRFPLGLTGLIFLLSKGPSGVFSSTTTPPPECLVSVSRLQLSSEVGVRVRIRVRVRVGVRLRVRVSHLPKAVQLTGDRARI